MKKLLALLMVVILAVSLCACGNDTNGNDTNDNDTKLTIENYTKYLNVDVSFDSPSGPNTDGSVYVGDKNAGLGLEIPGGGTYYVGEYLNVNILVEGVSSNINYNDLELTFKVSGTCKTAQPNGSNFLYWSSEMDVNEEYVVKCDIAGNGELLEEINGNGVYLHESMCDLNWEIISISGTVTSD